MMPNYVKPDVSQLFYDLAILITASVYKMARKNRT